ncbi:Os09g0274025 [Oryza sativa Japonica Group]|uniref:Os09g0274025 protein n=1 Tax=Oryza sativa subsp. japonica TaxID=39947 RepID=A0A0P0XLL5_ORYSJ|nr:hypothetical protein EE612_046489 [Oryza sativa]BAT07187.1 Os09g0274025 [Oryza sativa Japonica Group]
MEEAVLLHACCSIHAAPSSYIVPRLLMLDEQLTTEQGQGISQYRTTQPRGHFHKHLAGTGNSAAFSIVRSHAAVSPLAGDEVGGQPVRALTLNSINESRPPKLEVRRGRSVFPTAGKSTAASSTRRVPPHSRWRASQPDEADRRGEARLRGRVAAATLVPPHSRRRASQPDEGDRRGEAQLRGRTRFWSEAVSGCGASY